MVIDVPTKNAICVQCERLGFSFEVNSVRIDVLFLRNILNEHAETSTYTYIYKYVCSRAVDMSCPGCCG